ncbi:MAG: DUF2892 domain-containing protein [Vicinamibacterales bacterium]
MSSLNPNLGNADRTIRAIAAVAMLMASVLAPVPLIAAVGLVLNGAYLIGTSLVGTCLGYKLIGVSTCPIKQQRAVRA